MSLGTFKDSAWLAAGLLIASLLAACEEQNAYIEPPPPKVTVAQPLIRTITDYLELTGTTSASARVEIRARVPGVLQSMHFDSGVYVAEGDLLFVINPEEYEADLKAAEAELARAEALRVETGKTLKRSRTLRERGHLPEAKLDEAEAQALGADAEVLIRQAALNRAQINLSYTEVRAPVSGRVGRNLVDLGNLVGEGEATVLTEITVLDPMYVYFNLNELDLLKVVDSYRARVREKGMDTTTESASKAGFEVFLGLSDEEGFPRKGILDFAESGLDPKTGTLQLRATFENAMRPPELYPGLFGRVRLPIAERPDMPLVTERAIGSDQSGHYLLVVNQENIVEKHNVELGRLVDGLRVIESGLRPEDQVVVNGIQRARPGGKVDPEQTGMETLTATAIAAASGAREKEESGAASAAAAEAAPEDPANIDAAKPADQQ
ncbi:MAG: efflux RND transporter periplasmic adaptor subunit [Rhodospirillales bacterium]|nr:efflux RND transporter periplasmic adaptor subunit [Rhodospirillales bacterium]MDH3918064.1 efflux RND transporter periplasmic adaptor subunit [Rhodospirillales bacterium]MDH3967165.1 efflux RND transporter periplasmic adaptor subunit [Rhodospirillales bacterium]